MLVLVSVGCFYFYTRTIDEKNLGTSTSNSASKSPLHGLVSMGNIGFLNSNDGVPNNSLNDLYARPGVFDGVVINVTWAQLEPSQGSFDTTVLDQALAAVRAYNQKYPDHPLGVRLDVWAGEHAPDWAKDLGGSPITINKTVGVASNGNTLPVTVGRFWTSPYEQAWTQLQNSLASNYDLDSLVREVGFDSCSSIDDEPFLDGAQDSASRTNLYDAGFSDSLYKNCLLNSFNDYAAWKNTYIAYPFNPFYDTDSGKRIPDSAFTTQVMRAWRQALGTRAVLSNHGLDSLPWQNVQAEVYNEFPKLGPIIEFQLKSPSDDYDASISRAISLGATAVEVWDGSSTKLSFLQYTSSQLAGWSAEIKKNQI